jgi:autotransporter adhesin
LGNNSVILGNGSDGSQSNVVSIGAKGSERKIVNVAAGTTTTDAVNLGQMTSAIAAAGTGGGGSTLITQAAAGADLLVGGATDGTHVNFANNAGVARELLGVAAGTKATSAVNLSQLTPVVAALGGGAAINSTTGAVTGPTYSIGGHTTTNAGDAFKDVDTGLTNLNNAVAAISADTGGTGLVAQDPTTQNITVGKMTGGTVVDVTNSSGVQRTITGVAAGAVNSSSFDAINGSQLFNNSQSIATAIGGGAQMNSDGSFTQPTFNVGGGTVHNVGDAISNLDSRVTQNADNVTNLQTTVNNITAGGGVAAPNAVSYDSSAHDQITMAGTAGTKLTNLAAGTVAAGSTDAVTGDQLYSTNQAVDALQTSVTNIAATGSTSIGINGINGTNGTNGADGTPGTPAAAASATGSDAIAMGDNASASGDHAVVIGGGASGTGDGTIAIGGNAGASGTNSIAIGNGATAPANNAVALGANSVADRDNSVSVGSQGNERQITNVAAGTQGTDAVNLNQMNSAVGGIARKAYSGIAAATALTMIPDVDANKTLSIGIGGGTFQGYAASAIGGTARITQNIKVRVGAGWSAAGTTVGAGASYQW